MTIDSQHRRRRARLLLAGAAAAIIFAASPSEAEAAKNPNVRFGLGGSLGDPLGGSMKLFVHPQHALQFEIGWAPLHHGDGITHFNYLFHFKPFVRHDVLDFGMYIGGGIGVAFWATRPYYRDCYDPPGPDDWRCDGYYDYAYRGHYGYARYPYYRRNGGAGMIIRPPVLGLYVHFQDFPVDVVMEGAWSPYVVISGPEAWDPFHGDVSFKARYYF